MLYKQQLALQLVRQALLPTPQHTPAIPHDRLGTSVRGTLQTAFDSDTRIVFDRCEKTPAAENSVAFAGVAICSCFMLDAAPAWSDTG